MSAVPVKSYVWQDDALCSQIGDQSLWFPERGESTAVAKAVCGRCPVWRDCLAFEEASRSETSHGVWGGLSVEDREAVRAGRVTAEEVRAQAGTRRAPWQLVTAPKKSLTERELMDRKNLRIREQRADRKARLGQQVAA